MTASRARNRLRSEPDALARVPLATYRVQLGPELGFEDAAGLLDYLDALGITDLYTSPFFESASSGSHGYDVSDHDTLRGELGGEAGFRILADALKRRGFGLLIDLVPNHMGIAHARNHWWRDVLEHGPSSRYAAYFDIDWRPVKAELHDRVLLPILGDQYGAVLDRGELSLALTEGLFELVYYEWRLPIAARSYGRVLGHRLEQLQDALGADHADLVELKSVITWLATIPPRTERDPARVAARDGEKERGRQRLVALLERSPGVRAFVDENVRRFNGTPGEPRSFDLLDDLVSDQAYRPAYWRVAGEEINYRRFFDINDLAAIRMEDREVFDRTHRVIFQLVRDGAVTGLRIDHPDGLYAPAEYFARLQEACLEAVGRPFYVVAEKILSPGERLPENWAVAGSTGYDFLNLLNGIFVDRKAAIALERLYVRLLRQRVVFTELVYDAKRLIMETSMASELNVLGHRLNRISEKHRSSRDFTLRSLTRALREIIAAFPVYRTYFGESGDDSADIERLDRAVDGAKRRTPTLDVSTYDWVRDLLALRFPAWADEAERRERIDFVMRVQQITGPVTAKGYEDTALYRYNRLTSLNEVGGDPSRFGTPLGEFHTAMAERQDREPASLSATSTHDTKRSEDVRARINVLSEIADEWRGRVGRWQRLNRRLRTVVDGDPVPGANEEYLLYQTLVGAWPIDGARLRAYILKAVREAKTHTSWINMNQRYDEAIGRFAEAIVDPRRSREFLRDLAEFQQRVAHFGRLNSLAQTLVKIAAPGLPDFYQGTELWDFSLVDPDNRRPVDFALRRRMLEELTREIDATADLAGLARRLVETAEDGRVKLYLIRQALQFRRLRRELFISGAYHPLTATGTWSDSVCAFARARGADVAVVIAPRLLARRDIHVLPLGVAYWDDTRVAVPVSAGTPLRNVFTGRTVAPVAEGDTVVVTAGAALEDFPVALLERSA
ncbi:MAG: malto-oligosyltrehalose synthase [Candidatus Rokubacteria bacterium]|nr:malto-oligosyltrehalose synthase [Candidatus Rokubacteria bacterium]